MSSSEEEALRGNDEVEVEAEIVSTPSDFETTSHNTNPFAASEPVESAPVPADVIKRRVDNKEETEELGNNITSMSIGDTQLKEKKAENNISAPVEIKKAARRKPPAPRRKPPPPRPARKSNVSKPISTVSQPIDAPVNVNKPVKTEVNDKSTVVGDDDDDEQRAQKLEKKGEKLIVGFRPTHTSHAQCAATPPPETSMASSDTLSHEETPEVNSEEVNTPSESQLKENLTLNSVSPSVKRTSLKSKKKKNSGLFSGLFAKKPAAIKWSSCEVAAWLELLGLDMYTERFLSNGVDGSTLLELDTRQFMNGLGITNECHIVSLELGVLQLVVERIDYDNWEWTAEKVQEWLKLRGFGSLVKCFKDAAIHGGVLFNVDFKYFIEKVGIKSINGSPIFADSLAASIERAKTVGNRISEMRHGERLEDINSPGVYVVKGNGYEENNTGETIELQDWGSVQVEEWLKKQHVVHLSSTFRQHGVNGTILLSLTREKMEKQMGLTEIQAIVLAKGIYRLKRMQRKGISSFFRKNKTKGLQAQRVDRKQLQKLERSKSGIPVAQRIDFDVEMEVEREMMAIEGNVQPNSMAHRAKKFGEVLNKMRSVKSENNLNKLAENAEIYN